jgi:Flp pilus assembly protein TadB
MADDQRPAGDGAEPPGELIHLPGPSYLPVLLAFGIALAVVGVVVSIFLVVAGVAISAVVLVRWIREARQEMAELPLEHH